MKKILILTTVIIATMCSCTKNEISSSYGRKISFTTTNFELLTRASESGTEYPTDIPFKVWAWSRAEATATTSTKFMDGEVVSYNSSSSIWTPANDYYWTKTGVLDFIAISPSSASGVTVTESKIEFKDFSSAAGNVDLMYSGKIIGATQTTCGDSGVPVEFHHALAKLNFTGVVSNAPTTGTVPVVTVKSVKVSGIVPVGTATLNLGDDKKWGNCTWTASTTAEAVGYNIVASDVVLSSEAKSIGISPIVIPQTLKGTEKLEITFTIKTGDLEETVTSSADLKTTTLESWGSNESITYNISITPSGSKKIVFSPSVAAWDTSKSATLEF